MAYNGLIFKTNEFHDYVQYYCIDCFIPNHRMKNFKGHIEPTQLLNVTLNVSHNEDQSAEISIIGANNMRIHTW